MILPYLDKTWTASRPKGDIIYTEDDVMSPSDYAAGFRRWAPEAPKSVGVFMAEARKRYEREHLGNDEM